MHMHEERVYGFVLGRVLLDLPTVLLCCSVPPAVVLVPFGGRCTAVRGMILTVIWQRGHYRHDAATFAHVPYGKQESGARCGCLQR